jgi:MFS family permease
MKGDGAEQLAEAGGKASAVVAAQEELALQENDYEHYVHHRNPIRRFITWWLSWWIPGMGMMAEAYFVFSIGNLKGIFKAEYPTCFDTHLPADQLVCSPKLTDTLTYTQVGGIIAGQLGIGFVCDRIGRKWGSVLNASLMFVFGILMSASVPGGSPNAVFTMFTVSQALFGVGVGGEYPVASTSANERAENTKHLKNRRGETVVCVFSMQGWGNLINTMVLVILMAAAGQYNPPYNPGRLDWVWRVSYGIGLIPITFMLFW